MKHKVNMQETEEGFAVWAPGLPGGWSQGKNEKEALENTKYAIQEYLKTVDASVQVSILFALWSHSLSNCKVHFFSCSFRHDAEISIHFLCLLVFPFYFACPIIDL
jgi:predicted RNase H-like HicB family nuclease